MDATGVRLLGGLYANRLLWASEALSGQLPPYRKGGQARDVHRRIPDLVQTRWEGEGGWLKARDIALFRVSDG